MCVLGWVSGVKPPSLSSLRVVTAAWAQGLLIRTAGRVPTTWTSAFIQCRSLSPPRVLPPPGCLVGCTVSGSVPVSQGRVRWLGGDRARRGAQSAGSCCSVGLGHVLEHGAPHFLVDLAPRLRQLGLVLCGRSRGGGSVRSVSVATCTVWPEARQAPVPRPSRPQHVCRPPLRRRGVCAHA